jgi:hypothetical protein
MLKCLISEKNLNFLGLWIIFNVKYLGWNFEKVDKEILKNYSLINLKIFIQKVKKKLFEKLQIFSSENF